MKELREQLVSVLMRRDGLSRDEAIDLMREARQDMLDRLAEGEMPYDICEEWFGLEPDYIECLM